MVGSIQRELLLLCQTGYLHYPQVFIFSATNLHNTPLW